jgi:hypothetical protein
MRSHFRSSIFVFLLCLFSSGSAVSAIEGGEVIFYPTDVSQAGEMAYLRDSVRMMLAGRLSSVAGIQPRFEEVDGRKVVKEYRVQSRVVSDGEKVVVSVSVLEPSSDSPLSFQVIADDSDQLMVALDKLVAELGEVLFGVKSRSPQVSEENKTAVIADFHTPHPDRQLKENSGYGMDVYQEGNEGNVHATGLHKSAILSGTVKAMTAGDLDGDGVVEILLASDDTLNIFQLRNGLIQHRETISLPSFLKVHGLNVADLTGNGIMEVYVSATRQERVGSCVLEWDPQHGVSWLYKDVPRYLRPLNLPGEGWKLLGQQAGVDALVAAGIFRLDFGKDGKLVDGAPLLLPDHVNLFEFVFADTNGNGSNEIVTINEKWQLQIYSSGLDLLLTTDSGYGGRDLILGRTKAELESQKEFESAGRDYIYMPIRLVVADVNGDGREEIIFAENERYSPGLLSNSVLFRNGVVKMLTWDGLGLVELFHTNTILNAVTDFQFLIEDSGKQGHSTAQLFVVEPKTTDIFTSFATGGNGSRILAYDLELAPLDLNASGK